MEKNLLSIESIKTVNKPGILHYINNINFNTKRFFYLDDFSSMNNENNKRGFHANINFDELMFIVNGSVNVKLIDKSLNIIEKTISKNDIYFIPRMNWLEYEILDKDSIIIVFANENLFNSKTIINFEDLKLF